MMRKIRCMDKVQTALLINGGYPYEISAEEVMMGTGRQIKVYHDFMVDNDKLTDTINQVNEDIRFHVNKKLEELNNLNN
jgi:hypothetical protein